MADVVTEQEVRHVAQLARLGLGDERVRQLARDMSTILEHMAVLSRLDTTVAPYAIASREASALRGDHGPPQRLEESPEAFAPQMRDGLFIVPRLSSHEDAAALDDSRAP
jgi:aspartyl-tRNA(Asn)/glutamyl-tRNA(Gln) amidotransferase subunit C